jgi:hypothetical protein
MSRKGAVGEHKVLRALPTLVLVALGIVLLAGTGLGQARQAETTPETRAVLNSDLGWVNLRQCTKATCAVLDQADNGTVVIVRCIIDGQVADPDNHPGADRWFLVTRTDGRYVGASGYVYAPLVSNPPSNSPHCLDRPNMTEIQSRYPLIPEASKGVTLARGPAATRGYWYAVTVSGLRPNSTLKVRCFDSEDDTPTSFLSDNAGFRSYPVRTDGSGNAYSDRGCFSAVDGEHTVSVDDEVYSNSVLWGASPAGQPSTTGPPQPPAGTPGGAPGAAGTVPPGTPAVLLGKGASAPAGYRYAITLTGFPGNTGINVTCYDSTSPAGFYTFTLRTDGAGSASVADRCYSADGPDHWVTANGVESNHVAWSAKPGTPPPPPPPSPSVHLAQGPTAPAGYRYAITLNAFAPYTTIVVTCHDSVDPGGFYTFNLRTDNNGCAFTQNHCYSGDHPDHWARANGVESNHVTW